MKNLSLLALFAAMFSFAFGQLDTVTIQQIQMVPAQDLAACIDTSIYLNDTVVTYGTVVVDGGLAQAAQGRNIWLQSDTGAFSGLDLYTIGVTTPVPGTDILDLVAGDSIEVTGIITRFGNETEIVPLQVVLLASGKPVLSKVVSLGDLNDNMRNNQLPTGEQWEGSYIELQDLTVQTVTFFAGGNRVSFDVSDANGNLANISDRFLVQRMPASGGTFVPPSVGTKYEYIRGIVAHSANGCLGANGRGYEIYPFDENDYQLAAGFSSPVISNINRNQVTPTTSQDVNVFADIVDLDGIVTSATLKYAIGISNTTYTDVAMAISAGNTYMGTIPSAAFAEGAFVKYYICAEDDSMLTSCRPDVPNLNPLFFRVRDNGTTVEDVQFTPFSNGNTGYLGLEVTVEGVVTASAESGNLGTVYMQQEGGLTGWSGIALVGNTALATLLVGEKVTVTGIAEENFGLTRIGNISAVATSGTGTIDTLDLEPAVFSSYDFATNEQYECMVIRLKNSDGTPIFIVDDNPDGPGSNFGEYRIGSDLFDPNSGSRVVAGRQDGNAPASLNVSYINDSSWITTAGILNVPACVITYGDSMNSMMGIMYYSFGNMKLFPRNNSDVEMYSGANCPNGITGIEDIFAGSEVIAYPNPVSGRLIVDYEFPIYVQAVASMYDLMGRPVASQSISGSGGSISFDTQQLAPGNYFLTIVTDNYIISRKKIIVIN